MKRSDDDKAALINLLKELHLPTIRSCFEELARQAEQETLSYERYLLALVEHGLARNIQGGFGAETEPALALAVAHAASEASDLPLSTQAQEYYKSGRPFVYRHLPFWLAAIAERLLIVARDRIFRDFMARMRPSPSDQVLDVGVSDVVNDGANVLECTYVHQANITACGIGAGVEFQQAFPLVRYVRIEPNVRLPFDDRSFDIATSNAVLEHVGNLENQMLFVRELSRVAKRVFITVPNRFSRSSITRRFLSPISTTTRSNSPASSPENRNGQSRKTSS
jgi:hypothetical protein